MCCGNDFFHPDFTSHMFFCFSYAFPIPAPDAASFSPTRRWPLPEGQARASIFIAARVQASAHVFAHSVGGLGDGGRAPWPPRDGSRRPLHLRARACAGKGAICVGLFFFSARVASRAPPDLIYCPCIGRGNVKFRFPNDMHPPDDPCRAWVAQTM